MNWTQPHPDTAPYWFELWLPGKREVITLQPREDRAAKAVGPWVAFLMTNKPKEIVLSVEFELKKIQTAKRLAVDMLLSRAIRLHEAMLIAKGRTAI